MNAMGGATPVVTAASLSRQVGPSPVAPLLKAISGGLLTSASAIGLLATSGWLITRASQRPPVFELSIAIGAVQAFALARGLNRYWERLGVHEFALEKLGQLRLWLYGVVEPLVPDGLRGFGVGSTLGGLVSEVEAVALALVKLASAAIDVGAAIVIGSVLALLVAPAAGAALIAGSLLGLLLAMVFARAGRAPAVDTVETRALLADQVVDALRSAQELTMFGREDLVQARLDEVRRRSSSTATRRALAIGATRGAVAVAAGGVLIAVILTGLAARDTGAIDGVMLTVLTFVALAVLDQVKDLPAALADIASGDAAAARLADISALHAPAVEPSADHSPVPGRVTATFSDVTVDAPDGGVRILDGVNLRIDPSARVAITGPSGAGKTTLLHTLLHFLEPSTGAARLNGIDVRDLTRGGLAHHLAWLPEDVHLFVASVRDNVRLARPHASDAECTDALRKVGLEAWFASLPEGLETRLGAGGRQVSAGERQRLGMARLLLSEASVVVLDEPTAHLAPDTSPQAMAAVVGAAGARSILMVSHDEGVAGHVDRVVELAEGRIATGLTSAATESQ